MSVLVPCPTCRRHIRASEPTCPFCTSVTPSDLASRAIPGTQRRMKRAAVMAFASSMAVVGCSSSSSEGGNPVPVYGAPAGDTSILDTAKDDTAPAPDTSVADTGFDSGFPMVDAAYGGPPFETGLDTSVADAPKDTFDGGGAVPAYGLPPPDTGAK